MDIFIYHLFIYSYIYISYHSYISYIIHMSSSCFSNSLLFKCFTSEEIIDCNSEAGKDAIKISGNLLSCFLIPCSTVSVTQYTQIVQRFYDFNNVMLIFIQSKQSNSFFCSGNSFSTYFFSNIFTAFEPKCLLIQVNCL